MKASSSRNSRSSLIFFAFSTESRPVIPNELNSFLRCEICCEEDIVEGSFFDQFLRTPHLKTKDLRCLISSSAGDTVDLVVGLEVVEGLAFEILPRLDGFLDFCLRGFAVGGVASFRIDRSESLSSFGVVFRFFFGGDLSTDSFFSGESSTTTLAGLLALAFTGDDGGVS